MLAMREAGRRLTGITAIAVSLIAPQVASSQPTYLNFTSPVVFARATWSPEAHDFVNGDRYFDVAVVLPVNGDSSQAGSSLLSVTETTFHWTLTGCDANACYYEWDSTTGKTTTISANVNGGFLGGVDQPLARVIVQAVGVPGRRCTHDPASAPPDQCTDVTVDVNATWIGEGAITRGAQTYHEKSFKGARLTYLVNSLVHGASSSAAAVGFVAGTALPTTHNAQIATSGGGFICIGCQN